MPRHKRLLKKVDIETVKRMRTCKFSKVQIGRGDPCLVVQDGTYDKSCYSKSVALEMISAARKALDELEQQLS